MHPHVPGLLGERRDQLEVVGESESEGIRVLGERLIVASRPAPEASAIEVKGDPRHEEHEPRPGAQQGAVAGLRDTTATWNEAVAPVLDELEPRLDPAWIVDGNPTRE